MHPVEKTTAAAAFALAAILTAAIARADSLTKVDGQTVSGIEITRATWETVSFVQQNIPRSLEGFKVLEINRGSNYIQPIRNLLEQGNYAEALNRADNAMSLGLDWEKPVAAYLKGEIHLAAGKPAEAVKALESYLQKYEGEKDFYVPHATSALAQAYLESNKASQANTQFAKLEQFGGRDGLWFNKSKIGQARAIILADNAAEYGKARGLLNEVRRSPSAPELVKREATVLYAVILVKQKQYTQAENELMRSIIQPTGGPVFDKWYAYACEVVGDSYFLRGGGQSSLEEAELWYLRATLFGKNHASVHEEAGRALIELYEKMGKSDRASEWKTRIKRAGGD